MSKNFNQLLGHGGDNDGIDEYDNPLPTWWLGLFAVCIVWAVVYGINWHFVSMRSQVGDYEAEMAAAAIKWPQKDVAFELTPEAITAGKEIFTTNCVPCHGATLEGGIGPNLIDNEWIHGGEPEQIVHTITNGVPEKGMVTWGPILGAEKIAHVAAYVYDSGKANR